MKRIVMGMLSDATEVVVLGNQIVKVTGGGMEVLANFRDTELAKECAHHLDYIAKIAREAMEEMEE